MRAKYIDLFDTSMIILIRVTINIMAPHTDRAIKALWQAFTNNNQLCKTYDKMFATKPI